MMPPAQIKVGDFFLTVLSMLREENSTLHFGNDPLRQPSLWVSREGNSQELNMDELRVMFERGDFDSMKRYVCVVEHFIGDDDKGCAIDWEKFFQ